MKKVIKIIFPLLIISVVGVVYYNLINPTKLNYFVASKIYKAPANTAFTDDNFYKCVVDAYNKENKTSVAYTDNLTDEQLKSIYSLDCNGENITSLDGIEKLTALKDLKVSYNQLTSLDVSKNIELTDLDAYNNQLMTLNTSGAIALRTLEVYNNQLTELDVSKNTALTDLRVYNNQLTTLNTSGAIKLTNLQLTNNQLRSLDVSTNTALTTLNAYDNQLTTLNTSGAIALKRLIVYNNQLTSLDVSTNTELTDLDAHINQLTSLDVSQNTALTVLDARNNQLTILNTNGATALSRLYLDRNQLRSLDVSQNTALTVLNAYENQLIELDVSTNTALSVLIAYENQLKTLNTSGAVALESLNVSNNQLRSLDVSQNTALTNLKAYENQLIELDVSKNTALTLLDVDNNQLTQLDVSKNISLKYLDVYGNLFTKNVGIYINDEYEVDEYETTYLILPDARNSTFQYVVSNNGLSVNNNIISSGKIGKYTTKVAYKHNYEDRLNIYKYHDIIYNIYVIEATSDKYEINAEEGYIYTKTDTDPEIILSNINLNYGEPWVEDNKLLIKYEDEIIKSFDIVNISSGVYKITDDYIYYEDGNLVTSNIKLTNATTTMIDAGAGAGHNFKLCIKYKDKTIDILDEVTYWSRDYDLTKDYIFDDGTFNLDLIKTMNLTKEIIDNKLIIRYKDEVFESIDIVKVESEKYDLSKDYIYSGINNIDLNDINVINGSRELNDDSLTIKYNSETLKQYPIYNINFEELRVSKTKTITVIEETTYEDFISNITTNGVTYKIYNGEEEVTTGNITPGMTLKVYVGEELVDTYEIIDEYLEISDNLKVNETNSMIEDLTVGQTVEDLISNIDTTGNVKVVNQENNEVTDTVGTGYKVVIELSKETIEYTLVVSGDITGDGEIKMSDVMKAATQMIEEDTIVGDCYLNAADVTGDGKIKMSDVMKLANLVLEGGNN